MALYDLHALRIPPGVDPRERLDAWFEGELAEELSYEDGLTPEQADRLRHLADSLLARDPLLRERRKRRRSNDYSSRREASLEQTEIQLRSASLEVDVSPDWVGFELDSGPTGRDSLAALHRAWTLLSHLVREEGFVAFDYEYKHTLDVEVDARRQLDRLRGMTPGWAKVGGGLLSPLRAWHTLKHLAFFALVTWVPVWMTSVVVSEWVAVIRGQAVEVTTLRTPKDVLAYVAILLGFGSLSIWMARRYLRGRAHRRAAAKWFASLPEAARPAREA